jgi:RNA polymerase sigma factor for flagellar operon FliA
MTRAAVARDHYQEEEAIIGKYATLVKRIARQVIARLPASVQMDDLEQAGLIGLMEAVRLYDPAQGASFETYATIRVRGAMIDELRRNDWSPRSLSRRVRQLSEASRAIENETGRSATPQEIADKLTLSLDEYHQLVLEANNQNFFSLENLEGFDKACGDDPDSTYGSVEKVRRRDYLSTAIGSLSEREQLVLSLYYEKDMTLKEIGEVLGVSESRVCQIHGEATMRLRGRMGQWQ